MAWTPTLKAPPMTKARREEFREVFDYDSQPKERIAQCNLCGRDSIVACFGRDRYGFRVNTYRCVCGLEALSPRLTAEGYRRLYESGIYRKLLTVLYGREIGAREIRGQQRAYSGQLAALLDPHIFKLTLDGCRPRTVLDVGGSTGIVASKMARRFRLYPTILDPAVDELALADGERIVSTAEDFDPAGRKWDVILLCQTVDHLLDISGTLRKLHDCLSDRGLFWVDAVDCEVRNHLKIDHPFYLTEPTMAEYLKRAGFKEIERARPWDRAHIGFLCERSH